MARPSKFNESLAEHVFSLAKSGATDEEIAASVGISIRTLRNWKGKHDGFLPALEAAQAVADDLVEASLFQRCVGYSQPAVKHFAQRDKDGRVTVVTERYVERFPPDAQACMNWLANRRPQEWRHNPAPVDHIEGADGETIDADWTVEIMGETASLSELKDASRYYDRKPQPKLVSASDEQK